MALIAGPDGRMRCAWCAASPAMAAYHEHEWGFPVGDDRALFEKFCLEGFQAGLSWRTILERRPAFRAAFHGFDIARIAALTEDEQAMLMQHPGIIRNRRKIAACVTNARAAQALIAAEGTLAAHVWRFEPKEQAPPGTRTTCAEAVALARDLKRRGWVFVGPTTVFALMQAMGLVNDHEAGCAIRAEAAKARACFTRPA